MLVSGRVWSSNQDCMQDDIGWYWVEPLHDENGSSWWSKKSHPNLLRHFKKSWNAKTETNIYRSSYSTNSTKQVKKIQRHRIIKWKNCGIQYTHLILTLNLKHAAPTRKIVKCAFAMVELHIIWSLYTCITKLRWNPKMKVYRRILLQSRLQALP